MVTLSASPRRKIVDRIDTDKNGFVNHAELHYWIKHRQRRYIEENVNKHWSEYDKNEDGKISWEEYKNTTYGHYLGKCSPSLPPPPPLTSTSVSPISDCCFSDTDFEDIEDKDMYKSMLKRDERRFKNADRDHDGIATREQFTAFLHPEEYDYMRDVVVQVRQTHLLRMKTVVKHVVGQ